MILTSKSLRTSDICAFFILKTSKRAVGTTEMATDLTAQLVKELEELKQLREFKNNLYANLKDGKICLDQLGKDSFDLVVGNKIEALKKEYNAITCILKEGKKNAKEEDNLRDKRSIIAAEIQYLEDYLDPYNAPFIHEEYDSNEFW